MKETKTIYSPEELDEIAREYRDSGTSESADLLLKAYSAFLWKYVHLLKSEDINDIPENLKYDRELKGFLRLIGNNTNSLRIIRTVVHSWTEYDTYCEMIILFFETVRKWIERDDIHFPGFISGYFKYIVKKWIDKVSRDALNTVSICNDLPDNREEAKEYEITDLKYMLFSTSIILKDLTPQERYIIYLQKIKKMSDTAVGKKIGIDRMGIPAIRERALKKIKDNIDRHGPEYFCI